jgi:hypothetical protein
MDCVGCDKCRLWGKVQTSGVGTALKILFELDESALEYVVFPSLLRAMKWHSSRVPNHSPTVNHNLLTRSEVVALVNTLHRFTESLVAVNDFRRMWAREEQRRKGELLDRVDDDGRAGTSKVLTFLYLLLPLLLLPLFRPPAFLASMPLFLRFFFYHPLCSYCFFCYTRLFFHRLHCLRFLLSRLTGSFPLHSQNPHRSQARMDPCKPYSMMSGAGCARARRGPSSVCAASSRACVASCAPSANSLRSRARTVRRHTASFRLSISRLGWVSCFHLRCLSRPVSNCCVVPYLYYLFLSVPIMTHAQCATSVALGYQLSPEYFCTRNHRSSISYWIQ